MPPTYIQKCPWIRHKGSRCHNRIKYLENINYPFWLSIIFLGCVMAFIDSTTAFVNDGTITNPTPALRLDKQDLTTVLLVRNGNEQNHGRFINVRPEVGLLTSTARTFIQEGITTEYATQVVGTTLDNGRMYAHLLKKSSRILYDPLKLATDTILSEQYRKGIDDYESLTKSLPQSHNDLFNADKPDWRAIDDSIFLQRNNFISNTDLVNGLNEKHSDNADLKSEWHYPTFEIKAISPKIVTESDRQMGENIEHKVMPQKVLPEANLPTFTIKNHYEPSGYGYKNYTHLLIDDGLHGNANRKHSNIDRQPKYIFQSGETIQSVIPPDQNKNRNLKGQSHLSTVTYYGFSDFTTTVGDSVIVFSPSIFDSATLMLNANVTSITGEATINDKTIFTTKSYTETATSTITEITAQKAEFDDTIFKESAIYVGHNIRNETTTILDPSENTYFETSSNVNENSATDPLRTSKEISTTDLGITVHQDSSRINYEMTDSPNANITNTGGATTIFFESDPFTDFLSVSLSSSSSSSTSSSSSSSTSSSSSLSSSTLYATIEDNLMEHVDEGELTDEGGGEITEIEHTTTAFTTSSTQNEILDVSSTVIVKEIGLEDTEIDTMCSKTSQVFLTNSPKTLTTTVTSTRYVISDQTTKTLTDYHLDYLQTFDIGEATKYYCIQTVPLINEPEAIQKQPESNNFINSTTVESIATEENSVIQTLEKPDSNSISSTYLNELTSTYLNENVETTSTNLDPVILNTEVFIEPKEEIEGTEKNEIDDDGDEIELFYKTFYTTYTYLTTYFQEQNTKISSHTEVVTHVITSTVTNDMVIKDFNENIIPTTSLTPHSPITRTPTDSTQRFTLPNDIKSYLIKRKEAEELEPLIESDSVEKRPELFNENNICINDKTYYTTYTYYTTIFGDDGTEISSRTEVHTNLIKPTKMFNLPNDKSLCSEMTSCNEENYNPNRVNGSESLCYSNKSQIVFPDTSSVEYSTLKSTNDMSNKLNVHEKEIKRQIYDDQINSESNTDDEILTSAAVLLKTSFTTYTYYTTVYMGDSTNVISRLETISNTHTETLEPIAKTQTIDDTSLPITYFTTFTYWTKLAKEGHITTLSREETVSNIIIPSNIKESQILNLTDRRTLSTLQNLDNEIAIETIYSTQPVHPIYEGSTKLVDQNEFETTNSDSLLVPTTYYTTYTYYTTSYEANSTITNSRLETVTNIVTPTITAHLNNTDNTYNNDVKKKEAAFYELKKIIDGDGISTLYITTQIEPTWGTNGEYTEVTSTSSSLYVNETKKYLMSSSTDATAVDEQKQKVYKTGLVRLIDGTRIGNNTTTLYKSKVIGTIIDQRYAQIIESTSSFLFQPTNKDPNDLISSTQVYERPLETTLPFSHNVSVLQSSNTIQQLATAYNESSDYTDKDENLDEFNHDDSNTEQKQAFTPIIRPFAKHNRAQFLQKKTPLLPSSATIITRSDFTPTITATPALKSVNRFSSSRRGSNIISSTPPGFNGPSRRFGRGPLKHTSQVNPNSSRNRHIISQQQSRGASSLGFKRLPALSIRPTYLRPSVLSNGPSTNVKFGRNRFSAPTSNIDDTDSDDESLDVKDLNQEYDLKDNAALPHDQQQINSLLRNRKLQPVNKSNRTSGNARPFNYNIGRTRNNPLRTQSRATTPPTTARTTTTRPRSFQRPIIPQRDRLRSSSNLFPPRNIFGVTKSPPILETTLEEKINFEENVTDDNENDEGVDYDDEDDEDEILEEDDFDDLNRNRRSYNNVSHSLVNSHSTLSRVKRKADNTNPGNTNFRNRLGRLKKPNQNLQKVEDLDVNTTTTPHAKTTRPINAVRPNNKHHNSVISPSRSIRPTRFMAEGRSKFTLRDKDSSPPVTATTQKSSKNRSNFRRPQPFNDASTSTRISSNDNISSNSDKRRLKNYSGRNSDLSSSGQSSRNSIPTRSSNSANGRSRSSSSSSRDFSSRNRGRSQNSNSQNADLILDNDGTITVTHVIPVGTTIPIINGKITEYKEVVTAKTSTEILGPLQYTSVSTGGQVQLLLTRQDSSVNNAGITEVTQYILHETPTTTVTFTPTTIRGRRTSFSHILPSTVYSVERLTSTVQPQIISNAPLANILLSQLLLGNVGLSPGVNPFLAALGGATGLQPTVGVMSPMVATPVTEYRTHASTYVTTVFEGQSTVLPVTFQGKKILTTVYDTTAQTITATEFITDTIITTPSVMVPQAVSPVQPVVNSLLLQQLLLQQHLQNQQSPLEYPGNLLKGILDMTTSASQSFNLNGDNLQELDTNNNVRAQSHDLIQGDYSSDSGTLNVADVALTDQTNNHKVGRKKSRKSNKNHKRKPQIEPTTLQGSSVITLYVSGRRPGEFSTILSTVPIRPDNTLYKRHAPELFTSNMWNPFNYDELDEMNNDIINLDFSTVNTEPTPILNTFSNDIKQKPSSTEKNFPYTLTSIPVTSDNFNVHTLLKSSELFSV